MQSRAALPQLPLTLLYIGTDHGEGVKEISSGRISLKIVLCSWINGPVVFNTDIDITPNMSVMAVRKNVYSILFAIGPMSTFRWLSRLAAR